MNPYPPEVQEKWRNYQNFRAELMNESKRANLTPGQVAAYLEARKAEFGGYVLDYEIAAYRRSPDDWRGVVLPS